MANNNKAKNIETPERMLQLFEAYVIATKSNPFIIKDWVGAAAFQVDRKKERPLTMEGFKNYLAANAVVYYLGDYFANTDNAYANYIPVCNMIKSRIRQDQIEGGMAMIYNPSITQRLNNLVEKTENKHEVTEIIIKHGN